MRDLESTDLDGAARLSAYDALLEVLEDQYDALLEVLADQYDDLSDDDLEAVHLELFDFAYDPDHPRTNDPF